MNIYENLSIPFKNRGGAVPTYQSNGQAVAPGAGASARIDDKGGLLALSSEKETSAALAGLGSAIGKAGVDIAAGIKDYQKTKATELLTKYKQQMREAMYGEGGYLTIKGEAAKDTDANVKAHGDKLKEDLLKQYGVGGGSEELFRSLSWEVDSENGIRAQEWQGKQMDAYREQTWTAAAEDCVEEALVNFGNPEVYMKNLSQAMYYQEEILKQKGFSGEALEHGVRTMSGKVFTQGIKKALGADDLKSAERLLAQGGKVFGEGENAHSYMSQSDIQDAKALIKAKREALAAKWAAAQAKKEKEAAAEKTQEMIDSAMSVLKDRTDLTPEEKSAFMLQWIDANVPEEERKAVGTAISSQIKYDENMAKADLIMGLRGVSEYLAQTGLDKATPTEQVKAIRNGPFLDDVKDVAIANIQSSDVYKEVFSREQAQAAASYMNWRDGAGRDATKEECEAKMFEVGVRDWKTIKECEDYRGLSSMYPYWDVSAKAKSLNGGKELEPSKMKKLYSALMNDPDIKGHLTGGKALSDDAVKTKIAKLMTEDKEGGKALYEDDSYSSTHVATSWRKQWTSSSEDKEEQDKIDRKLKAENPGKYEKLGEPIRMILKKREWSAQNGIAWAPNAEEKKMFDEWNSAHPDNQINIEAKSK